MGNLQTNLEDTMAALSAVTESLEPLIQRMLQNAHLKPCREALNGLDELSERVAVAHASVRTLNESHRLMLEVTGSTPAQLCRLVVQLKEEQR